MQPRLLTIPVSHYCEKARWALDRQGVPFVEEAHLPFFHVRPVKKAGGARQVPVLVTDEGLRGSSGEIVRFADEKRGARPPLLPAEPAARDEVLRLVKRFDDDLGPHTRRMAYGALLGERVLALRYLGDAPAHEKLAARLGFPLVALLMKRALRIDAAGIARSQQKVEGVFAEVDALLQDGRRFLVGDAFTAADLTFAALAAPVLSPEQTSVPLPRVDEVPASFRATIEALRARPAGRHALRMFAEERARPGAPAESPRRSA